jgi:hypothetical protein
MNVIPERATASPLPPRGALRAPFLSVACSLATIIGVASAFPLLAEQDPASPEATGLISGGKAGAALRYRFENVDQESFADDAKASTLRARLNFRSGEVNGFSFFGEYDYVFNVGWDDYNAGAGNTPNKTQYPVVADPTGGDLNQAYIQWKNTGGTLVRAGRERIIYDNARFVGNVGWRQNEQTYDGVYFQHKASGFDWQAAWVGRVNRIFGRDVPAGRHDNNTWLLNVGKTAEDVGKLTGYYYDIDNRDAAAFSTATWGLRYSGDWKPGTVPFGFAAEFARQTDAHDNPVDYGANYFRLDLSAPLKWFTPYIGYESLGGDDSRPGAAFRTPLATLHAFNGWADKFLTTPDAGLNDRFAGVKGKVGGWSWDLLYHDFEAESGRGSFGEEVDASLSRALGEHVGLLVKGAWFNGAPASAYDDTTKVWVQLTADF